MTHTFSAENIPSHFRLNSPSEWSPKACLAWYCLRSLLYGVASKDTRFQIRLEKFLFGPRGNVRPFGISKNIEQFFKVFIGNIYLKKSFILVG